jgi:hypothetical protein
MISDQGPGGTVLFGYQPYNAANPSRPVGRIDHAQRRQPAAREHAALPGHQFHHLALRRLSVPRADASRPKILWRLKEMSDQFVAEIRIFGFPFAPTGWAQCNGQLLPIQQNTALFSLLGTTYGGNGTTNFALPNLMGNIPIHIGRNQPGPGLSVYDLGETGGSTERDAPRAPRWRCTPTRRW